MFGNVIGKQFEINTKIYIQTKRGNGAEQAFLNVIQLSLNHTIPEYFLKVAN